MTYSGEHIWVGTTGNFMIYLAFFTAIISFISYVLYFNISSKNIYNKILLKTGKISFFIHFISIFTALIVLFIALYSAYYEYAYVWLHTARYTQFAFKISALWAGKEGSLLFWIFCQALVSIIFLLISKEKAYKPLLFILPVQAFLVLLISNFNIFSFQIGESPFLLLREVKANIGNKIFEMPNYLGLINKGAGLNPLLQNFWMVIHPPILFAGFATALIPWALSMSRLTEAESPNADILIKKYSILAIAILGTGIMFGGAWAYVALSFGGFWTWDPVENASLIPFLILLAGLHAALVKKYFFASKSLFIIAYILIFYAAFMTRSGVLGSTSVHSFGEGAAGKLLGVFTAFLLLSFFILLIINYFKKNKIQNSQINSFINKTSNNFYEWTLFFTTTIFILSAFHIFFNTSIPLFNFIFGLSIALPPNIISFYNKWQSVFLIILFILMFFYFIKLQNKILFRNRLIVYSFLLVVIIILFIVFILNHINIYPDIVLFVLALICIAIFLSGIFFRQIKLNIALSHIGIAIFFLGVVLAFSGTQIITDSTPNKSKLIELEKAKASQTSVGIMSYEGFEVHNNKSFYNINFEKNNSSEIIKFKPLLLFDKMHGDVFEPSVVKTLWGDYFVYIVKAGINPYRPNINITDTLWIDIGKSKQYKGINISLERIETDASANNADFDNIILDAVLDISNNTNDTTIIASYIVKNGELFHKDALLNSPPLNIGFNNISADYPSIQLTISERIIDHIIIKAEYFPFINLVWLGLLLTLGGLILTFIKTSKINH